MIARRSPVLAALALALLPCGVVAADAPMASASAAAAPTPAPAPNAAEASFLAKIMHDLPARYPNPKAANAAGYVRFTNEDGTGAISYANPAHFSTTDPDVPAQLWYDVKGRLIGADFSTLQAAVTSGSPSLFGLDPKRFTKIGAHVHYVTCDKATAKCKYEQAVGAKKYATVGDVQHPTAEGLVKAGAVKDAASVSTVFLFPAIYDATVWVVPNPLGQFADKNPNVVPSAGAEKDDM